MFQEGSDHFEKFNNTLWRQILQWAANNRRVILNKDLVQKRFVLCGEWLLENDLIGTLSFGVANESVFGLDKWVECLNVCRMIGSNCRGQIVFGYLNLLVNDVMATADIGCHCLGKSGLKWKLIWFIINFGILILGLILLFGIC